MPKSLVVGNGHLLVNFENNLLMSDFYYPFVGMEDHTTFKHVHRLGVMVDGLFSWLNDGSWKIVIEYHKDSLVGKSMAVSENLGLELMFEDFVVTTHNILMRRVTLKNLREEVRDVKIFFNNDFHIYGEKLQDTAQYEPDFNGILHYRKQRYFLVSGQWESDMEGVSQFATGKSEYWDKEGTWRDAEDGKLEGNPIEQGSVDSTVGFERKLQPQVAEVLNFWIIAAENYEEVCKTSRYLIHQTPKFLYQHTLDYWKHWSNKQSYDFGDLNEDIVKMFKRSLLIIKSQIDSHGAILAANDSDIIKFNKDTYTYMWSRDASIAVMAMNETKYADTSKDFFKFCSHLLTKEGYMLHKYNPDGSVGSSWHPKFKNGEVQIPIQEDETALPLVALWNHYENFASLEFIYELYPHFVRKAGYFLGEFMDKVMGLPLPTYDLWEEQRGIFSYTASCTFAGLIAAAKLAEATANYDDAFFFTKKAELLRKAIVKYLYCEEAGRFLKKVIVEEDAVVYKDSSVDASLAFVWMMGVLPPEDPRIVSTMQAIHEHLWLKTPIGGIARYDRDFYHRSFDNNGDSDLPGNPWIITTLWYTNWRIEMAQSMEDLQEVKDLMMWVVGKANTAGILAEQLDPYSGIPLSVAPLTWSHAEFVLTVMRYRKKVNFFGS